MPILLVPDSSLKIIVLEYIKQHLLLLFTVDLCWKNLRLSGKGTHLGETASGREKQRETAGQRWQIVASKLKNLAPFK